MKNIPLILFVVSVFISATSIEAFAMTEEEKIVQQLNDLTSKCQNGELTPDDLAQKYQATLDDAVQNQIISQDDYADVSAQIPFMKSRCEAIQSLTTNIKICNQYTTPSEYRQCTEAEMDKLIAAGMATPEDKIQFMQGVDSKIAQMTDLNKTNSGHELNANRDTLLKPYQKKLNKIAFEAFNGLYDENSYYSRAMAILDETNKQDLVTKAEYENTKKTINIYKSYFYALGTVIQNDYELRDFHCSGNNCTSVHEKIGEHAERRTIRQREGFELTVGINGGVIFDEMWKKAPVSYDSLHTAEFWYERTGDGFDKLALAGFYLSAGYVPFEFLGFYIQQEFDAGKWLGDVGEMLDHTQTLGMTLFVIKVLFPFWASRFQLGLNFGIGMAYSGGDDRENYFLSEYKPAYIFNSSLNAGVALALKAGMSFDFFVTPEFAIGFKLDYNYIYNAMSDSTYDRNFGYEDIEVKHNIHFIQPGIQLTWIFPTSAFYSTYRGNTLADPEALKEGFENENLYPAPFDQK